MTQPLFDFTIYFKFFIGLFALANPVGIIPMSISMTSYQPATVHNKIDLVANLSVTAILLTSLFLDDGILQIFGILINSFCITGGILVVTTAMPTTSGRLGEDKQNKQEESEMAVRESIGVVPLVLPLMTGPGAVSSTTVQGARYHPWVHPVGFSLVITVLVLCYWGIFRMTPWLVRLLGQTGVNVVTRIMGLLLMALGIEFIVTGIKVLFPGLLSQWNTIQAWRLHFALARLLIKPINQRETGC